MPRDTKERSKSRIDTKPYGKRPVSPPITPTKAVLDIGSYRQDPGIPLSSAPGETKPDINSPGPTFDATTNGKGKSKSPSKSPSKDTKPKTPTSKNPSRPWSADELELLLDLVLETPPGIKTFEGRVPGRTGYQAVQTWR